MSAVPADLRIASPWRGALPAFALLLAVTLLLYRDTAETMMGIWWRSETFAHCMLVPPIVLWLVWRKRVALAALTPRPQPWVLLPLLGAAVVWMLSDLVVVNAGAQFAFVAMLLLTVPALLGIEVTRVILFPLMFLFFAVPFGEFVVPTMMQLTADFTVAALQMTGVPVFREGQSFIIPSGSWSVIDECSGVRYLMASFMVGTLFAYLNFSSYRRRAVFMVVAISLPVLANWLRAYMVVMLAHLSGNRIATGVDHILYGWVFFGVIIFAMFMVGSRWSQPDAAEATVATKAPLSGRGAASAAAGRRTLIVALGGVLIALLPPLLIAALQRAEAGAAGAQLELPQNFAGGWSSEGAQLVDWAPEFGKPAAMSSRNYKGPAGVVGVHAYYYRGQSENSKVVSSQNMLVGMRDPVWGIPVATADQVVNRPGLSLAVHAAEVLSRAQPSGGHRPHLVIWRLYWIDGHYYASDKAAKLAGVWSRLQGRGDEGAALLFYADGDTAEASKAALQAFLQSNLDPLGALLQRTRDAR